VYVLVYPKLLFELFVLFVLALVVFEYVLVVFEYVLALLLVFV